MDYTSSSEEENSSTELSSDSSDDEKLETVQVCGSHLEIPQGLCEQKDIWQEFFSMQTWSSLSEENKQHLKSFLPTYPENNEEEQHVTIEKLFSGENFRFTSPLMNFHDNLKAGHYRPDIAKIRYLIRKAERKEAKYRFKRYKNHLKDQVLESHARLLSAVNNLPPGVAIPSEKPATAIFTSPVAYKTRKRYFQELAAVRAKVDESEFSSDDNYSEGPPAPLSRKQKRHLNSIRNSCNFERVFVSTMASKPNALDLEGRITSYRNPFCLTEDTYKVMLLNHKRRKVELYNGQDLITKSVTLHELIQRTKLPYVKKISNPSVSSSSSSATKPLQSAQSAADHHSKPNKKRLKKEISYSTQQQSPEPVCKINNQLLTHTSNSEADSDSDSLDTVLPSRSKNRSRIKHINSMKSLPTPIDLKPEPSFNDDLLECRKDKLSTTSPIDENSLIKYNKITPEPLADLDGIDMMSLPIDLDESNMDILELNSKPELMQETHSNFLSLIRDIICSTPEHRMNMMMLEERLKLWQDNPISGLNDWYHLADNWKAQIVSAVNFLSGNFPEQPEDDFVPYIEYKPQLEMFQWIGAGRDSDTLLAPLCHYWLTHKNDMRAQPAEKKDEEDEENDIDIVDRSQTPPPPRCPTTWSVRKADPDEVREFREQERRRYDNPHKAFTYRCNGYESVVGPLKGIYNPSVSNTKARGHTMLSADRPNFVTILSLVRDATARLPNGEGTRADICELLKSSQYISSTAQDNVLQSVVSGALDRMHTQFDPCVKYDPKRKIWIYLHRNRTEEDFERIHQQYQGMGKTAKKSNTKSKNATGRGKSKSGNAKPADNGQTSASPIPGDKIKNNVPKVKVNVTSAITTTTPHIQQQHQIIVTSTTMSSPIVAASADAVLTRPAITTKPATQSVLLSQNPQLQKVNKIEAITTTGATPTIEGLQLIQPQHLIGNSKRTTVTTGNKPLTKTLMAAHEKEINEAIQAIQNSIISKSGNSPNKAAGKSLVKIIPTQGKSLIIPAQAQLNKNVVDPKASAKISHAITQQLLQTLTNQQKHQANMSKQTPQTIKIDIPDKTDGKLQNKLPTSVQQQIIQTISSQQLQNIKNVTLLRSVVTSRQSPVQGIQQMQTITTAATTSPAQTITLESSNITQPSMVAIQKSAETTGPPTTTQIRLQQPLTATQQAHLLQNLKPKIIPVQNAVLTPQMILKQKGGNLQHVQKQTIQTIPGTSLLGQPRIVTTESGKSVISTGQTPLVAKVLTNAAGQVISVESLLAHQKQHGSLPQGTTLRVSGVKGGQTNIIQLAAPTKQGGITQLAVGSQNNFIAIANQPKLVLSSQPTTTTVTSTVTTKPITKTITKTQTISKVSPKIAQQVINAKFITSQNLDQNQKIMQPKMIIGQNQLKIGPNKNVTNVSKQIATSANANTIRMVNAANLNLTHIGGKPVLLAAGKGNPLQNIQAQNVILQSHGANVSTSSNLVAISASKAVSSTSNVSSTTSTVNLINPQSAQVLLGSQIKMQQPSQVVLSSNVKQGGGATQTQNVVIGGHTVRLQTNPANAQSQRVVLASQGQGGQLVAQQILLPAGFQGTAINIKALPGVKVIPITQQGKGGQNRHFFKVMNPSNIVRIPQAPNATEVSSSEPSVSSTD